MSPSKRRKRTEEFIPPRARITKKRCTDGRGNQKVNHRPVIKREIQTMKSETKISSVTLTVPDTEIQTEKSATETPSIALAVPDTEPELQTEKYETKTSSVVLTVPTKESNFSKTFVPGESVLCTICLDTLAIELQDYLQPTYCGHLFHSQCLDRWMRKRCNRFCPVCRDPINGDHRLCPERIPMK